MKPIHCVIIDPSSSDQEMLVALLSKIPNLKIVGLFKDPIDALGVIYAQMVNLVFMELEIPSINGVDFAQSLPDSTYTIITTHSSHLAVKAFEFGAIDFMVKPINLLRMIKAINRAMQRVARIDEADVTRPVLSTKEIYLKSGRDLVRIFTNDIVYIEAFGPLSKVYTLKLKEPLVVSIMLSELTTLLPHGEFLRVHKSFIISIPRVVALNSYSVDLDNKRIPIGATYRKKVFAFLRSDTLSASTGN